MTMTLSRFDGQAPIDRQRAVNEVLAKDLSTGKLHSVRMKCWTPAQWQRQGAPHSYPQAPVPPPVLTQPMAGAGEATRDSSPEVVL